MSEKNLFNVKVEEAIATQTTIIKVSYFFAFVALVVMGYMIYASDDLKVYKAIGTINQTLFLMSPKIVFMVMFLSSLTVATKAANRTKDYIEMLKPGNKGQGGKLLKNKTGYPSIIFPSFSLETIVVREY